MKNSVDNDSPNSDSVARRIWHYTPRLPLRQAPYFEWPFSLHDSIRYLLSAWSPLGQRFFFLLVAIGAWYWFTPAVERAVNFAPDWMLEILVRNLVIVMVVAGGLHLHLFVLRRQGDDTRYDARPLAKNSGKFPGKFHFGHQVRDNLFWTLCSSVPVGTLFECLLLWGYANGHATLITFQEQPVWFVVLLLLIPVWSGWHFYWQHRLLHTRWMFKYVHCWHHKNINTGPWSGHAMHPLEHVILYSDLLVYFVLASHPVHIIFNAMLHTIAGPTSHCGYERVRFGKYFSLQLGDFMHQLHHRYFDCNYGNYETPWDKIFGSFHDGTPQGDRYIAERRKRMYADKRGGPSTKGRGAKERGGC